MIGENLNFLTFSVISNYDGRHSRPISDISEKCSRNLNFPTGASLKYSMWIYFEIKDIVAIFK